MKGVLLFLGLIAIATSEYVPPGSPAFVNDNNVLQYALTLENLENTFYTQGLALFSDANFTAAGFNSSVRAFLTIIAGHETAHVAAITNLLTLRGAVPVTPCNYTFNFTSVPAFLLTAATLERTGVSAYDGAIASLTQTDLITLAAGVATVEARHSAFLNLLVGAVPFPNVTDIPLNEAAIVAAAGGFFDPTCTQLIPILNPANALKNATDFRNVTAYNQTVYNQTAAQINDNNVLQYALTLENLEATFYANALSNISAAVFTGVVGAQNYAYIQIIAAQEATHVAYLNALLIARMVTPVPACSYAGLTFTNDAAGFNTFLSTAASLETVGVGAYIGASTFLTDEGLLTIAASVATVEARHTSFLTTLMGNLTGNASAFIPFPNVVDTPLSVIDVLTAAQPFFTNLTACITFSAPVAADNFRPNGTIASSSTSGSGSSSSTSTSASGSSSSMSSSSTSRSSSSTVSSTRSSSSSTASSSSRTSTSTSANSDASMMVLSLGVIIASLALMF